MRTQTTNTKTIERERLLQLAEEYHNKGYEISFHPSSEDLPDFLKNYRPNMIARRDDETVVIEVKSRLSLDSSTNQYLGSLAQQIEQHSGWRFELVITNSEDTGYSIKAEETLQENEIKFRLNLVQQLVSQHPESALVLAWVLAEATLRLVAEREKLSLSRVDPLYLIKLLATEGIISKSQYQLLINSLSLRNTVAHGFKTTGINQDLVNKLINVMEDLLNEMNN